MNTKFKVGDHVHCTKGLLGSSLEHGLEPGDEGVITSRHPAKNTEQWYVRFDKKK